jgi:hypothetical protein
MRNSLECEPSWPYYGHYGISVINKIQIDVTNMCFICNFFRIVLFAKLNVFELAVI